MRATIPAHSEIGLMQVQFIVLGCLLALALWPTRITILLERIILGCALAIVLSLSSRVTDKVQVKVPPAVETAIGETRKVLWGAMIFILCVGLLGPAFILAAIIGNVTGWYRLEDSMRMP